LQTAWARCGRFVSLSKSSPFTQEKRCLRVAENTLVQEKPLFLHQFQGEYFCAPNSKTLATAYKASKGIKCQEVIVFNWVHKFYKKKESPGFHRAFARNCTFFLKDL
jgi:hypothetical protein